jgi:hypothetical protein
MLQAEHRLDQPGLQDPASPGLGQASVRISSLQEIL